MMAISEIFTDNNSKLSSFAMMVLAASPLLYYYEIGNSKISLLTLSGLIVLLGLLINNKFDSKILPISYLLYWGWCSFQMYFIAGISGWSDYLPGGILLFIFSLLLIVMTQVFDFGKLFKYMKWIFIIASLLLLLQYIVYFLSGIKLFVFPLLTDNIQGRNIMEMYLKHMGKREGEFRFCSIFIEPSYFGQYGLVLLAIELFRNEMKYKLYSKFSIFIVFILFVLRSGTGLLGLLIITITKVVYIVFNRNLKYWLLLAVLVPITVFSINYYLSSASGSYVSSRLTELDANSNETSSGSARIFYGWTYLTDLSLNDQIFGTSRAVATEAYEKGFSNMATYVATSQGIIGLFLLVIFYFRQCLKHKFLLFALFVTLITIALVEACYLGGLMLIVTTAILGSKYRQSYL